MDIPKKPPSSGTNSNNSKRASGPIKIPQRVATSKSSASTSPSPNTPTSLSQSPSSVFKKPSPGGSVFARPSSAPSRQPYVPIPGSTSVSNSHSSFLKPFDVYTNRPSRSASVSDIPSSNVGGVGSNSTSNTSNQSKNINIPMRTSHQSTSSNNSSYSSFSSFSPSPNQHSFLRQSTSGSFGSNFSSSSPGVSPMGSYNNRSPSPNTSYLLKPSPPPSVFRSPSPSSSSFLMPTPSPSEALGYQPKTKTIGFVVPSKGTAAMTTPTTTTSTTSANSNISSSPSSSSLSSSPSLNPKLPPLPTNPTTSKSKSSSKAGTTTTTTTSTSIPSSTGEEEEIQPQDLEFDSMDSDLSDNQDGEEDYDEETSVKDDDDIISPPQKEFSLKENKSFVHIESLNSLAIEKMVMEGWKHTIPRFHQKDVCVKILQDILEQYKTENGGNNSSTTTTTTTTTTTANPLRSPNKLLSPRDPILASNSPIKILSPKPTDLGTIGSPKSPLTPTIKMEKDSNNNNNNNANQKNVKNYLIQHAAGSGKSLSIASLVYNLYRLLEDNRLKYDLILVLNDRRHLDTQLGSIISQYLRDNDLTSFCHPSTVAVLEKILNKAKTRVIITTMQKLSSLIDKEGNKFDLISSKYKSIALISDEAHRSHGKSMSRNIHSILTGETRQLGNITYFCFTCTPTPKCLEMFGDTRGNLRVPFHTYSLEKALQDKIVMNVIENYTTVAILTKITNQDKNNDKLLLQEKKASYHLLKNAQNDKKIIQEKSSYIIKHFIKLREMINTDSFKCRAMLVTSNRKQILLYKTILESIVKTLPKEQRFDIVASFSPFILRKKVKMESDIKINGKYAKYCLKRNGISEIIRSDRDHKMQLIIVAEKLQTGFDEPSLSIMYVDKPLKGANAVQTIGRLSRVSQDKKACYVVDFINTRRDISDAFGSYWRETCLKGVTRKTVLELKLSRILTKLSNIEPLYTGKLQESIDYILADDEKRKKERKYGSITDDITHFVDLCNQLFWDNNPPMNARFLEAVKFSVCQKRINSQMTSIRGLLMNIENKSSILGSSTLSISPNTENSTLTNSKKSYKSSGKDSINSSDKIINNLNKQDEYRVLDILKKQRPPQEDIMDLDGDELDFAREIWSANPEFKLNSRLLDIDDSTGANTKDENMDDYNNSGGNEFGHINLKMFEQAETIEQVIDVVVEFVSRNGSAFESFIQNQALSQVFPFVNVNDVNHQLYKSKLEKARAKYNREQKLLYQQQQIKEQQAKEQQIQFEIEQQRNNPVNNNNNNNDNNNNNSNNNEDNSDDVVMSESPTIAYYMKTPWNNSDIPFPTPLPTVAPNDVVGKPHTEGRMDDCLLGDCVLSFCHDLESKDPKEAPVRVFAIQTLGILTNKGIHKNNMHEIVGSIQKILLNRQENTSIKMISLDLLALVATQDELTITQIIDLGIIPVIVKLINSAEEPIKAKCCKFINILCNEVAIVSALLEAQGIMAITNLLESYDYVVTEQALRSLIALAHEERTIKVIRTFIDPSVWSRLEHHKIPMVHDLTAQLKTIINGSKRSLQQFTPSLSHSKRIKSSNSGQNSLSSSRNNSGGNPLSISSPNLSIGSQLINNDNNNNNTTPTTTTTTTSTTSSPKPILTKSR
ncbi:hypothetical protein CYY_009004 [Polysphondylium violaceum]|uniref:Uncharacterized protein n=1 Tax=Polysphondylium violaceum TaxID=133409 RepID=A0A8J4PMI0_9MYCE|nr:hypothetical protein CYY_009004 [Polysphondylium violaceum]